MSKQNQTYQPEEGCSCKNEPNHEKAAKYELPGIEKRVYILENLGCANCAAKMESKIRELPEVEYASITFSTKQLRVSSNYQEKILPVLQQICESIESEVKVVPKEAVRKAVAASATKKAKEYKSDFIEIAAGASVFIVGMILENFFPSLSVFAFIVAYAALGLDIVWNAIKNLLKGQLFDENFLMSIATIGAFAIKEYPEAVGVMLFYRIGELFEHIAVEKSRSQIMEAVDMRPEVVNLVEGNDVSVIPAGDAAVDDILLVRPGDRIPLDGIIVEGESRIDTAPVTGESIPVKAVIGDTVISGCVNTSGLLKIRVQKILEESMVSRILDSVENAAANKPKIDRFITRFARVYTPFVVILALSTAIIPSLIFGDWNHWVYTALTFLVISCPCALVLSVPLAFFSGIGSGSRRGILFKGGVALEALSNVKAVVLDKTGTITKGNFVVHEVVPATIFPVESDSIPVINKDLLLSIAASCESASTHPIGISIVNAAKEQGLSIDTPGAVTESAGKGILAILKQGEVLCGNRKLMKAFDVDLSQYANDSFGTEVLVAINGIFAGHLIISDTLKEDAISAVSALKKLGIVTAMLTGDSHGSASAIAKETGIQEVHAKLMPADKLTKLLDIRKKHGAVMFVGDGINDAPVLAGADVGAAMGNGADAAIEAADVVFMTSSMEAIPQSLMIARSATSIAKQNVIFALAVKALVMLLGLAGYANMWMAVFADSGVAMLCVLNSIRILYKK